MRKKILTIAVLFLSMPIFAQDGFFNYQSVGSDSRSGSAYPIETTEGFGVNNMTNNQTLPLGNGLLLLAGAGLGYAFLKKKEETK